MSIKTEALVRDLAALFVKYRLSDWKPLVGELETRGGSAALAEAILRQVEQIPSPAPAKRRAKKKAAPRAPIVPKTVELELEPRFTGPNAATMEELRDALVAKRSFPSMSELKAVITALGIKGTGTGRRETLVTTLTQYLDGLDAEAFERALRVLAREEGRNQSGLVPAYDRWFDLITVGRKSR